MQQGKNAQKLYLDARGRDCATYGFSFRGDRSGGHFSFTFAQKNCIKIPEPAQSGIFLER